MLVFCPTSSEWTTGCITGEIKKAWKELATPLMPNLKNPSFLLGIFERRPTNYNLKRKDLVQLPCSKTVRFGLNSPQLRVSMLYNTLPDMIKSVKTDRTSFPAVSRILKMADILGATTWALSFMLKYLPQFQTGYASVITDDSIRPDLVSISRNSILSILELTVGFESNIKINSDRRASKDSFLVMNLKHAYSDVRFVNPSMITIAITVNPLNHCS